MRLIHIIALYLGTCAVLYHQLDVKYYPIPGTRLLHTAITLHIIGEIPDQLCQNIHTIGHQWAAETALFAYYGECKLIQETAAEAMMCQL